MFFSGFVLFSVLFACANVHGRSLDSDLISPEDADYYLGASSTSKMQEFEVVSPWEVENSRKKREADNPFDISEFKFSAFGEEFHLQLTTNRQLTPKGLKVHYVDADGNVEERPLPSEHDTCYKFGRVLSHEGASRVAVSTCNNGLAGIIKLEGYELFIQKLTDDHTDSVRRKRRDLENPHIVYRRSADDDVIEDTENGDNETDVHFCGLERPYYHFMEDQADMELPGEDDEARRRKREACSDGSTIGTKTLELLLVIDSEMNSVHSSMGRSATDVALALMNTVASSYLHDSLGVPLIIKIVQMRVLQSTTTSYGTGTLTVTADGGTTLTSFCKYQKAINSVDENSLNHFDNAVLMSGYDLTLQGSSSLLGIAQFNGACSRDYACALVEESGFGSSVVITHELGHNLGMEHDGDGRFSDIASACTNGVNIMASARTYGPNSFIWSSCSAQQLQNFLCHPFVTCLDDSSPSGNPHPLDPNDMPGVRYTADEQCRVINSLTTQTCSRSTCGHLACLHPNGQCVGTGVASLDGTSCGTNRWCVEGNCVDVTTVNPPPGQPPVDGGWSAWTTGPCSVTCGQGVQSRTRQCNNPPPQNGGQQCSGSSTDTLTCFQEACPVSVNGGWSPWSPFGACSVTCGGGQRTRTRTCTNPTPQNGGLPCFGSGTSSQVCNTQACPVVINGGWSSYQFDGPCSATCGGGQQTLRRTCDNPRPQNGGANCVGSNVQIINCNTQECLSVVDGGWSSWQNQGSCSRTCGGGQQTQIRYCTNPVPQNGGAYCVGSSTQTINCNTQSCPSVVNGGWSSWQNQGSCSRTCGGGQQTQYRYCNNPVPQNGGAYCSGNSYQVADCNVQACGTDGGWSNWGEYSACSVSCGYGHRSRYRTCTNPAPQNGGQTCTGSSTEYQQCSNSLACSVPVNGGWSSWSLFGACSVTCGGGQQTRSRTCTNPTPQNGGSTCSGSALDSQSCSTQSCPTTSGQTVRGTYNEGTYREYNEFLSIPVGATAITISNTNLVTFMAVKHGNNFVIGDAARTSLPPRTITTETYQGTPITHDYFSNGQTVETITIAGPTSIELTVLVYVLLNPDLFGTQAIPSISWSFQSAANEYRWVLTEGPCSVTCGSGTRTEVVHCALIVNQQQYLSDDESICSHLVRPTPSVQTCNEATCNPDASWYVGQLDCSGLCGQASGRRTVYCIATSASNPWQIVDDSRCPLELEPSDTADCQGLPPCVSSQTTCNTTVTTEGSINRMISPTGGELCAYTIVAPLGMLINVRINSVNIACSQGEELVFKDAYNTRLNFCEVAVSPGSTKQSRTNVAQIEHRTTQAGHGYNIEYSFVSSSQPSSCDEILMDSTGIIQSPSYPNNYGNNLLCKKYIVAPADMKIAISFNTLSLFGDCARWAPLFYDYLKIHDYDKNTYRWFCGHFDNPSQHNYESISNRVLLTFRSDNQNVAQGFQATYSFVPRN
ncbi:A disintegrin and metalloproteinase with thrombospondin motifs 6-like isoform X2 [Patiria miniata]|uniref:Uncharacterized protein n=1 Tax=Patiria miniata TaxID=46514 RepID=A0A914AIT7_PATMI|nr:A disintegrin and metalloproteinase with thrombospondin motifs 6-like isoform X2 [Patiria miniata]